MYCFVLWVQFQQLYRCLSSLTIPLLIKHLRMHFSLFVEKGALGHLSAMAKVKNWTLDLMRNQ